MHDQRYLVPGLLRGLDVLHTFTTKCRQQTIADIARAAGLTRTAAFRIVCTLEHARYIRKVPGSRNYELDSRVLDLGHAYLSSLDMIEVAKPILEALRNKTHTSTYLMVREGRDVVYVARALGTTHLVSTQGVGSRLPAHATAPGRILLSGLSNDEIRMLYKGVPMASYSGSTKTTIAGLVAQLESERSEGSIVSWGEYEPGVAAVAAPVHGQHERVVAAVSATCPLHTYPQEFFSTSVRKLTERAALEISRSLGNRD